MSGQTVCRTGWIRPSRSRNNEVAPGRSTSRERPPVTKISIADQCRREPVRHYTDRPSNCGSRASRPSEQGTASRPRNRQRWGLHPSCCGQRPAEPRAEPVSPYRQGRAAATRLCRRRQPTRSIWRDRWATTQPLQLVCLAIDDLAELWQPTTRRREPAVITNARSGGESSRAECLGTLSDQKTVDLGRTQRRSIVKNHLRRRCCA